MRATGAKPGLTLCRGATAKLDHLHGALLCLQNRQLGVNPGTNVGTHPELFQALGDGAGNDGRRQVGIGAQQRIGRRVGVGPFAA